MFIFSFDLTSFNAVASAIFCFEIVFMIVPSIFILVRLKTINGVTITGNSITLIDNYQRKVAYIALVYCASMLMDVIGHGFLGNMYLFEGPFEAKFVVVFNEVVQALANSFVFPLSSPKFRDDFCQIVSPLWRRIKMNVKPKWSIPPQNSA